MTTTPDGEYIVTWTDTGPRAIGKVEAGQWFMDCGRFPESGGRIWIELGPPADIRARIDVPAKRLR